MPLSPKTKTWNRNNIKTNSVKTLKMVPVQKNLKKNPIYTNKRNGMEEAREGIFTFLSCILWDYLNFSKENALLPLTPNILWYLLQYGFLKVRLMK